MKQILAVAALLAISPACSDTGTNDAAGDGGSKGGGKVSASPNLGEKATKTLSAADGGELTLPKSGVTLSVPAGALAEDTELTAEVVSKTGLPDAKNLAGNVIEFGPDGLTFLKPVGLEIGLAGAKIPDGADVSIAWLDEKKNEWVDLEGSKVSGDKVSATTTHFTKFVIRWTITDTGMVVQESGQCDLTKFTACGGDVEGTWEYSAACVNATLGNKDPQDAGVNPILKCISVEIGLDLSGTVTFAGGTMTGNQVIDVSGMETVDKACYNDAVAAMAMGQAVPDVECSSFDQEAKDGKPAVPAVDTGDTCTITIGQGMEEKPIDSTYSVKGTTITTTDSIGEDGGVPEPEVSEYCVSGDTLTILGTGKDGAQFMFTAKRTP